MINGITYKYAHDSDKVLRGLMLRYINNAFDFNSIKKIDSEMRFLQNNEQYRNGVDIYPILTYWKFFILSKKEFYGCDEEKAFEYLEEAYKAKSADAKAQYAYYYYTGQKITNKVDKKKANKLFEEALKGQNMFAEYLIAESIMYNNEKNIDAIKQAIPYYEKALAKHVIMCKYKLIPLYRKVGMDPKRADYIVEQNKATLCVSNVQQKNR